jgi:hypothetical protein
MHLLYLDESGSASDPSQKYFVLAGVSVFEREGHWIEQELNNVAKGLVAFRRVTVPDGWWFAPPPPASALGQLDAAPH